MIASFERVLDAAFLPPPGEREGAEGQRRRRRRRRRLVFFGPKFEPWLQDHPTSRKVYVKLSKSMRRACDRHLHREDIKFIDCLTMFCGDSATVPGAVLGGKAVPVKDFFDSDGLHLSDAGYLVWRDEVNCVLEHIIAQITEVGE